MGFRIKLPPVRTFFKGFKESVGTLVSSLKPAKLKPSFFKSETEKLFKNVEIPSSVIPDKLPDIEVKRVKGELTIQGQKWSDLSFHLESGRIRKFWDGLKMKNLLGKNAKEIEDGVRLKRKDYPAKKIADLEENIDAARPKVKDYDVKIDDVSKLPEAQKSKLTQYCKNAGILAGTATVVVGAAASFTAAGLAIDQIIKEMHRAKGCFLFDANIPEGRCKLLNRSCANNQLPHRIHACEHPVFDTLKTNCNLMLRYLKKSGTDSLLNELKTSLLEKFAEESTYIEEKIGKIRNKSISASEIEDFIDKAGFEDVIDDFYERNFKTGLLKFSDFCGLLDDKEREETACVACNPSAPHNSLQYVNIDTLPDTERPRCSENPTAYEALCKITGDTPADIADAIGLTGFWQKLVAFIGVAIVAVLVFLGIIYAIYWLRKRRQGDGEDDDDEVSYSELENEDDNTTKEEKTKEAKTKEEKTKS